MAEAALKFLSDNLTQLVVEHANLISNVRNEVDCLRRDLPFLKAIIEVSTDTAREDNMVKQLVTRIREVTFKAEDAIDAYVIEATTRKGKKWIKKVFSSIDHAYELCQVAKDVQTIRDEVEQMKKYPELLKALGGRDPAGRRMDAKRPDVEKDNVVGFDEATETIIKLLKGETKELQVVSIIGMGGLGKTTLANKVFNDPIVKHEFSTLAWIYVSAKHSIEDLFLSILKCIVAQGVTSDMSKMGEDDLAEEIRNNLPWKYLIVVDDVWEKDHWTRIKKAFPDNGNGSRILLTTREKEVAVYASGLLHSPPYELYFLTHAQSWELLQKKVWDGGDCPQEDLKEVGIRIAVQCDGLPLAVVVIAGILQNDTSTDAWETIAESVKDFLVRKEKDLMEVLALSYYHLPPHLKACFLYFGVFPQDYKIPFWILIRLWIAERFVQTSEKVCLEKMAEEHLKDLVARNLLLVDQRSLSGRIKTCRIHDMLRDLCVREAVAENFLLEIKDGGSNSSSGTINRRLCIHSDVLKYIAKIPPRPHVRSFLCFAKDQVKLPYAHKEHISDEFKLLRVYHIQPVIFPRFPIEIEELVHLTYVAFSGDFNTIPAVVSKLRNLQTLIAETSSHSISIIDIKADISKMLGLRHLHTNKPGKLHCPVTNDHKCLQTLTTITPESCTKDVLGQTPNLKKLGICGKLATFLQESGGSHFDNITALDKLTTLKLTNDTLVDHLPSDSKLKRLPPCSKFPRNLKRLTLTATFLEWDQMDVLGTLPKLEELKLKENAFSGVRWTLVKGHFKKLKALQVWKTNLVYLEDKADDLPFPSLQHIVFKDCPKLWEIPFSLGKIKTLQTIRLHQTSRSAADSARKIKQQQQESKLQNGLKLDIFPSDL